MDKQDRRAIRLDARQALSGAFREASKLILIYIGVISLFSAALMTADFFLARQIDSTGGLSGIGTRSALATLQSVLRLAQTVLLPFWNMGYLYVTLKLSRSEAVSPSDLLEGFRRVGPVMRLQLLKTTVFAAIGMAAAYIGSFIFFLTPFSTPMLEKLMPLVNDSAFANDPLALQEAMLIAMQDTMLPLIIIWGILFLLLAAPLFYRYRMSSYFLLDETQAGALAALRRSRKLMRYLCTDLFRLDLSFWWFYLLEALAVVIGFGDVLLGAMGILVPFSADSAYFLFYFLYLVGQAALYWRYANQVQVTYARAYDFLRSAHDPRPKPKPQNQPWSY